MKLDDSLHDAIYKLQSARPKDRVLVFDALVPLIQARLYAFIYRYCPAEASDLLQDVLLRIWENIDQLRDIESFWGWSFRIARHSALSHIRHEKVRKTHCYSPEEIEIYANQGAKLIPDEDPEHISILCRAMDSLNELEKEIVTLRYFDKLDWFQVGSFVGLSEDAVRVSAQRIRKKLARKMKIRKYAETTQ